MRRLILLVMAVVLVALILLLSGGFTGNIIQEESFAVKKVVDGDTVRLSTGEKVRFLNIDTPETGQYMHDDAAARLEELIGNSTVSLESDKTNKDKYGRLLRYVYVNETMLNLVMVKEGYARSYYIAPDDKHLGYIQEAESYAKSRNLGIWKYDSITGAFCIWVYDTHPDPKGRDDDNLNGEYVVFRNSCTRAVDMTGWNVSAERGSYNFQNFTLDAKKTVTLHTGSGINNSTDVYWSSAKPVWKNSDDRLLVYNSDGIMVLDYSY